MSLIDSHVGIRVPTATTDSRLLPIPLLQNEIAVVKAVFMAQHIGVAIDGSTRVFTANLSHYHVAPTLDNYLFLPGNWAGWTATWNALTSGGMGMIQSKEFYYPEPGFWIGGDQLFFVNNLSSGVTLSVVATILYETKKVSDAVAKAVRARTVRPASPEQSPA